MTMTKRRYSDRRVTRRDAGRWNNPRSGFGGLSDPQSALTFRNYLFMNRDLAEAMYEGDWLTRAVIEAFPEDETRRWLNIQPTESAADEQMRDAIEDIDLRNLVKEARINARLHGGALLVFGANDGQDPIMPLDLERTKVVSFAFVVDRYHAWPEHFYSDPDHPKFGKPEVYRVHRLEMNRTVTAMVHETRCIRFEGNYLPRRSRLRRFGWSASILESVYEAIRDWGSARQVSAALLQDFVTSVMKIENLRELIATKDWESVSERLDMIRDQRSVHNTILIGDTEEVEKKGTPVTNLIEFVNFFTDTVCAAGSVPRSRLFKAQGGQLGGDGGAQVDLQNYYDRVAEGQQNELGPKLRRAFDIIGAPYSIGNDDIEWDFAPLHELTEQDKAEVRLRNAQADQIYLTHGVFTAEEVAVARAENPDIRTNGLMISSGRIEEVETVIEEGDDEAEEENEGTPPTVPPAPEPEE